MYIQPEKKSTAIFFGKRRIKIHPGNKERLY